MRDFRSEKGDLNTIRICSTRCSANSSNSELEVRSVDVDRTSCGGCDQVFTFNHKCVVRRLVGAVDKEVSITTGFVGKNATDTLASTYA